MPSDPLLHPKRQSLSIAFKKTCVLVNNVVKPHPDFVIPRSRTRRPQRFTWSHNMHTPSRSPSRRSEASRDKSLISLAVSESFGVSCSSRSYLSDDDSKSRRIFTSASSKTIQGLEDQALSIEQTLREIEQRVQTTRQRRSSEPSLTKISGKLKKGNASISRLQRSKGQIQSSGRVRPKSEPIDVGILHRQGQSGSASLSTMPLEEPYASPMDDPSYGIRMVSPSKLVRAKSLTPILEHVDAFPEPTYLYCGSSFVLPEVEPISPIQFINEDSGAIFTRVNEASGGLVSPDEFERNSLKSSTSLSLHIGSPPPAVVEDIHDQLESLPSFVLTVPTPEVPQSPVFVPQSPFTIEKFTDASRPPSPTATATTPKRPVSCPIPTLPRCCQPPPDGETGELCRSCEMQMLACKVWYQENDSGRRQTLREPLIKPGESTASNRALMEMLGLPAGSPHGVAVETTTEPAPESDRIAPEIEDSPSAPPDTSVTVPAPNPVPEAASDAHDSRTVGQRGFLSRGVHVLHKLAGLFRHSRRSAARIVHARGSRPDTLTQERPTSFLALDDNSVPGSSGPRTSRLWRRS